MTDSRPIPINAPDTLKVHDARQLVGEDGRAFIVLDGTTYQLRITRSEKLILTK